MSTLDTELVLSGRAPTTDRDRSAAAHWFARAWAWLRPRLADNPVRVLELNDHLLGDIGVARADVAYRASFWPIWRPAAPPGIAPPQNQL